MPEDRQERIEYLRRRVESRQWAAQIAAEVEELKGAIASSGALQFLRFADAGEFNRQPPELLSAVNRNTTAPTSTLPARPGFPDLDDWAMLQFHQFGAPREFLLALHHALPWAIVRAPLGAGWLGPLVLRSSDHCCLLVHLDESRLLAFNQLEYDHEAYAYDTTTLLNQQ